MIFSIVSPQGSGKTLTMTFIAFLAHKAGLTVYSNYRLNFPHEQIRSPQDLMKVRNGMLFLDEAGYWLDSRVATSRRNRFASAVLMKSRKRGYDLFVSSQLRGLVDNRIRESADFIIIPRHDKVKHICDVTVYNYAGQSIINNLPASKFSFNAEPVYKLYDSYAETYAELDAEMII